MGKGPAYLRLGTGKGPTYLRLGKKGTEPNGRIARQGTEVDQELRSGTESGLRLRLRTVLDPLWRVDILVDLELGPVADIGSWLKLGTDAGCWLRLSANADPWLMLRTDHE
jgi:hypothetical protein